jgi:hypothetical protein
MISVFMALSSYPTCARLVSFESDEETDGSISYLEVSGLAVAESCLQGSFSTIAASADTSALGIAFYSGRIHLQVARIRFVNDPVGGSLLFVPAKPEWAGKDLIAKFW